MCSQPSFKNDFFDGTLFHLGWAPHGLKATGPVPKGVIGHHRQYWAAKSLANKHIDGMIAELYVQMRAYGSSQEVAYAKLIPVAKKIKPLSAARKKTSTLNIKTLKVT